MVFFKASGKNLNLNDESQHGLLMQLLKLSYNCLNYDFIGTSTDESSDDLCTVQIPTSWRSGRTGAGGVEVAQEHGLNLIFLLQRSLIPPLCNSFSICIIPSRRPFPRWYVCSLAATDSPRLRRDSLPCLCSGVILSGPDRLRQEVPFQQCRTSQVPFASCGRSQADTSEPTGVRLSRRASRCLAL